MGHAFAQAVSAGLFALLLNVQEAGKPGAGVLEAGRVPAWIKLICVDRAQTSTIYFVRHSSGDETIHIADGVVALVTGRVVNLNFLKIEAETLSHDITVLISQPISSLAVDADGDPKILDCAELWAAEY